MRAAILAIADQEITDPTINSRLDGSYPAIEATEYETEGSPIYDGTAATERYRDVDGFEIHDNGILETTVEQSVSKFGEWIADFDAGWLGIDSSDLEFLYEAFLGTHGVSFHEIQIDVEAFSRHIADYPSASAWNVTRSSDDDDDERVEKESIIHYHQAANLAEIEDSLSVSMVGFHFGRGTDWTRGVVSESGYVAIFDGPTDAVSFAEFVNTNLVPFIHAPDTVQSRLPTETEETA